MFPFPFRHADVMHDNDEDQDLFSQSRSGNGIHTPQMRLKSSLGVHIIIHYEFLPYYPQKDLRGIRSAGQAGSQYRSTDGGFSPRFRCIF
jgi:hypothetical protein